MSDQSIPAGFMTPEVPMGEYNKLAFIINSLIGKIQTATLVQIQACTNAGGVSPVGSVDVLPLVNQVDSNGRPTPHLTIFNVPYQRMQGGANAVILDPQIGDIGICLFASRDISKVKRTKSQSNPGSGRKFDYSDGLYIGGVLNGTPSQYVQFSAAGIKLHSPIAVILEAPDIQLSASTVEINAGTSATVTTPTFTINGATVLNGGVSQTGGGTSSFSGDVTAQGTSLHNHTHTSTSPGTPTSPPL